MSTMHAMSSSTSSTSPSSSSSSSSSLRLQKQSSEAILTSFLRTSTHRLFGVGTTTSTSIATATTHFHYQNNRKLQKQQQHQQKEQWRHPRQERQRQRSTSPSSIAALSLSLSSSSSSHCQSSHLPLTLYSSTRRRPSIPGTTATTPSSVSTTTTTPSSPRPFLREHHRGGGSNNNSINTNRCTPCGVPCSDPVRLAELVSVKLAMEGAMHELLFVLERYGVAHASIDELRMEIPYHHHTNSSSSINSTLERAQAYAQCLVSGLQQQQHQEQQQQSPNENDKIITEIITLLLDAWIAVGNYAAVEYQLAYHHFHELRWQIYFDKMQHEQQQQHESNHTWFMAAAVQSSQQQQQPPSSSSSTAASIGQLSVALDCQVRLAEQWSAAQRGLIVAQKWQRQVAVVVVVDGTRKS